jgi:hypothetical protein
MKKAERKGSFFTNFLTEKSAGKSPELLLSQRANVNLHPFVKDLHECIRILSLPHKPKEKAKACQRIGHAFYIGGGVLEPVCFFTCKKFLLQLFSKVLVFKNRCFYC